MNHGIHIQKLNNMLQIFKIIIITSLFSMILISCSSEKVEETIMEKVTPQDKQLKLEDFTSIGLKKNKAYKVEELPKALSAYFGFIKFNEPSEEGKGKKVVEYELRIYPSHEDAINYGTGYAEERVGPEAKLKKSHNPRWKEGLRDARVCIGDQFDGGKNSADCGQPKFNEFYIYGNVVILCEGRTQEIAKRNCNSITSRLEPSLENQ